MCQSVTLCVSVYYVQALQDVYRRFTDYTDGQFHSDYLMWWCICVLCLSTCKYKSIT